MENLINEKLECAILGCLINNGELFYKVTDLLSKDCFTSYVNQCLFECVRDMQVNEGSVSSVKLYHRFKDVTDSKGDELKQNYVDIISASTGAAVIGFVSHVKTLVELRQKRQIQELLERAVKEIADNEAEKTASNLLAKITDIITVGNNDNSVTIQEAMQGVYDELCNPEPQYKATTGLNMLDTAMGGGMQQGRVYAFLAAAKMGKSMLASTISNHLNECNRKHLFVCAEMDATQITHRMLGQRLNLPSQAFLSRKDDDIKTAVGQVIPKTNNSILFENEPAIDFDRLKVMVEKYYYKHKIEGFILDYYQLVSGQKKGQSKAEHLEDVANWIQEIGNKYKIWCLLLVQSNDEGQVLASRGLNRACSQQYAINRQKNEDGIPTSDLIWLTMKYTRYTKMFSLGSESNPMFKIHHNGTHIEEI